MSSQLQRNATELFRRLRKYLALFSGFRPSFRPATEDGNFSEIGDVSREFTRDLTRGGQLISLLAAAAAAAPPAKAHSWKILHDDIILPLLL